MEFALSEEQGELAATVRAVLTKQADSTAVRAAIATDEGYDKALWSTLCEQVGVAALADPGGVRRRRGDLLRDRGRARGARALPRTQPAARAP